jgi:hypothetical protein
VTAATLLLVLCAVVQPGPATALRQSVPPAPLDPAVQSLDRWVVTHFRGAQLFPDPEATRTVVRDSATLARVFADVPHPRVEVIRAGPRADTLLALHFTAAYRPPALSRTGRLQLVGPTGTITPVTVRLLGRRAFRVPHLPARDGSRTGSNWRYGWVYLAVVPHVDGQPATRYRGWLLLGAPTS